MKGFQKALSRTPHLITSRVGMSKKSSDPVTDNLVTRFTTVEDHVGKLVKDATAFRDAVNGLLSSSTAFAHGFETLFQPMGGESSYEFESKFPQAKVTIQHIGTYTAVFDELKETIRPEVELIESRILAPVKEFSEYVKKVRKTITKREHKLVDFDRHNNSYTKLRDKKEKSLNDEKNLFKVEQDYEAASSEYEHYNTLLQEELPRFFQHATNFVTPLFHSFYYMQLNIFYVMLEKMNGFATETGYGNSGDVEGIYLAKQGDAAERLSNLSITKRGLSTAQILSQQRGASGTTSPARSASFASRTPPVRTPSTGSYAPPPGRTVHAPLAGGSTATAAAPPPYSPGAAPVNLAAKRAPPPPPPALKARPSTGPKPVMVTALYDFQAQSDGDLSFQVGDRIEIVKKSDSTEDWWTGRLNGMQGVFPANYVQLE